MQKKMGITAKNWFRENYQAERWFNGSAWEQWLKPKRYNAEGTTAEKYGTLMSKRDHLFRSIDYVATARGATIFSKVPYAKAHNEGDEFDQEITITPKMRKWAWYMYYKELGVKKGKGKKKSVAIKRSKVTKNGKTYYSTGNAVADKYAALALTPKQTIKRHIKLPRRPFIYNNAELAKVLRLMIKGDIKKIMQL